MQWFLERPIRVWVAMILLGIATLLIAAGDNTRVGPAVIVAPLLMLLSTYGVFRELREPGSTRHGLFGKRTSGTDLDAARVLMPGGWKLFVGLAALVVIVNFALTALLG